jgi:hypothetical protein
MSGIRVDANGVPWTPCPACGQEVIPSYNGWQRHLEFCRPLGPCIFTGCVSRDRHWHFGFPGGYDNPSDPDGAPILFTIEPAPGVRDYNGALLK